MRSKFIIPLLLSFSFFIYSQNNISHEGEKIFDESQVKEDINILYESLVNYHASPFLYISEDDLRQFKDKLLIDKNGLTETEIHILSRQLIANIGCGHTNANPSEKWYKQVRGKDKYLPFDIFKKENKYYINHVVDNGLGFQTGDELLCINDLSISDIWKDLSEIVERDGLTQSLVEHKLIESFRTFFFFRYAKQNEFEIKFINKNQDTLSKKFEPTIDKLIKDEIQNEWLNDLQILKENNWSIYAQNEDDSIAYLKINHFADRKNYEDYYKEVFDNIHKTNTQDLIIDLRGNSGGYFENGNELLKFLTPEPFYFKFHREKRKINKNKHVKLGFMNTLTKWNFSLKPDKFKEPNKRTYSFYYEPHEYVYKGNIHVITNGGTFSQASLVASQLKKYGAKFYGQETGGTQNGNNAMLMHSLVLPHSKIRVSIPYYRIQSNYSEKDNFGHGVKPDSSLKLNQAKTKNDDKNKIQNMLNLITVK